MLSNCQPYNHDNCIHGVVYSLIMNLSTYQIQSNLWKLSLCTKHNRCHVMEGYQIILWCILRSTYCDVPASSWVRTLLLSWSIIGLSCLIMSLVFTRSRQCCWGGFRWRPHLPGHVTIHSLLLCYKGKENFVIFLQIYVYFSIAETYLIFRLCGPKLFI